MDQVPLESFWIRKDQAKAGKDLLFQETSIRQLTKKCEQLNLTNKWIPRKGALNPHLPVPQKPLQYLLGCSMGKSARPRELSWGRKWQSRLRHQRQRSRQFQRLE